jgi:hypothetical protein
MFNLLKEEDLLQVTLPEGKTQQELVEEAQKALDELISSGALYGANIRINGRLTTGMALMMGHKLAHVCKSVAIFDPKENSYVLCIKH